MITLRSGRLMSPGSVPLLLWTDYTLCVGVRCSPCCWPKDHLLEMWPHDRSEAHTAQRSQCIYESRKKGCLTFQTEWKGKGIAKAEKLRVIKCFSSCCRVFGLYAGFVGRMQPVHRDKVVREMARNI